MPGEDGEPNMLPKSELDEMIAHEKRQVALEYQDEAWAGGLSDGIDKDIMAETAIEVALRGLVEAKGEAEALRCLEAMRERVECGGFSARTIQ